MQSLPRGFVSLAEASNTLNTPLNLIGVVNDFLPPKAPNEGSRDWGLTVRLHDLTNADTMGLRVKFFKSKKEDLPAVQKAGDVMVIRKIKVLNNQYGLGALSNHKTEVITFRAESIVLPAYRHAIESGKQKLPHTVVQCYDPTIDEQLYVIELKAAISSAHPLTGGEQSFPANPALQPNDQSKFSLIKDLGPTRFHDLVGEVIKTYPVQGRSEMDIYISDYTENKLLYLYQRQDDPGGEHGRDGDQYGYISNAPNRGWQGPFGQYTLCVRLYGLHADWARKNLNDGEIVFLRNVHIRWSQVEKLEGSLHEDHKFPDRVDIRRAVRDDPRVMEVQQRKAKYDQHHGGSALEQKDNPPLSKKAQKRLNKLKREEAEKAKGADLKAETKALTVGPPKNTHVRCAYPEVRLTPLSAIKNNPERRTKTPGGKEHVLPFVIAKWRAKVRVLDFFPKKLEDFASSTDDPAFQPGGRKAGQKQWEWSFILLVEDASVARALDPNPEHMPLYVSLDRAECLLKLDAADLRKDKKTLAKLREKLFILWGDLEEKERPLKGAEASNRAFECCILEYGVQKGRKWEARHAMAHTTIM